VTSRVLGLLIELYNSTTDPDLTEVFANTNVITTNVASYRYNFPSISTYTGSFATTDSTTLIISDNVALTEDAIFTDYAFDITGDVVLAGDLTAENFIVGSTNVITEITALQSRLDVEEPKTTALQGRLDTEEPKTSALQTLTATHTEDLATNTANILTKQPLITTSTDLETNLIFIEGNLNFKKNYFDTIVIRRLTGITGGSGFNNDNVINLNELQVWVNDTNIMINNGLASFYVNFNDKDTIIQSSAEEIYNNVIEEDTGTT
jgi:hypothetical protein